MLHIESTEEAADLEVPSLSIIPILFEGPEHGKIKTKSEQWCDHDLRVISVGFRLSTIDRDMYGL